MKRVIWDQPVRVGEWVSQRIGGEFNELLATAIGMERDGELIGGVIFDNYAGRSIAMHVAGEGGHWLTREFLRAVFGYAFNQLKVRKVLGYVDSTNEQARRFDEHIGFHLEHVITDAGKVGDLCIYSMTPEKCRWLNQNSAAQSSL